jgi:hypothetical protein
VQPSYLSYSQFGVTTITHFASFLIFIERHKRVVISSLTFCFVLFFNLFIYIYIYIYIVLHDVMF